MIANIEMVANLFLTKTGFAILLGVVFGLMGLIFPFLPRQYSTADFLIVGASSFALACCRTRAGTCPDSCAAC